MDRADIVVLNEYQAGAIATRNLGGCSGIVVLGRTAAIMAHVAPRPPRPTATANTETTSDSERHFMAIFDQVEHLYRQNYTHFPRGTTTWGIFAQGFDIVTQPLRNATSQRFAALGLGNRHHYYDARTRPGQPDAVRLGVRIDGRGETAFFVESEQRDGIRFPDPNASRLPTQLQHNYLNFTVRDRRLVHVFHGTTTQVDPSRFAGVYDAVKEELDGTRNWKKFDLSSGQWLS